MGDDFKRGAESMRECLYQLIPEDSDMPWWKVRSEVLPRLAIPAEVAIDTAERAVIAAAEEFVAIREHPAGMRLSPDRTTPALILAVRNLRALQQPAAPGESTAPKGRT